MENHPLPIALAGAVPLWIEVFRGLTPEQRSEIIQESQATIARVGEAILFPTRPGESRDGFNAVARAIAIMAYNPGGITIFGQHWEVS